MKKTLIMTSALVGAGLLAAAPAAAAEKIKLGLGGFQEVWGGFAEQDSGFENGADYGSFDVKSDTEIYVMGSTKLDNGLTISTTIEFEADNSAAGGVDYSFIEVSSDKFGTIQLGGVGDAMNGISVFAPDVGIGNTDGDVGTWIVKPSANFIDNHISFIDQGNTAKVNYLSPTFSGLQLVASYTPDTTNTNMNQPDNSIGNASKAYGFGAAYSRQIQGVGLAADVTYGKTTSVTANVDDLRVWQGGINLTYAGFTFGGSYANFDEDVTSGATRTATQDGDAWDLGLAYETGPYAVSLTYFSGALEGNNTIAGDEETTSLMLSGAYNMGPGVNVKGSIFQADYDDEVTTATQNNDGWGAVAGLTLDF